MTVSSNFMAASKVLNGNTEKDLSLSISFALVLLAKAGFEVLFTELDEDLLKKRGANGMVD